mgnify:FL=1
MNKYMPERRFPVGERFIVCADDILAQMDNLKRISQTPSEICAIGISVCWASYLCARRFGPAEQHIEPESSIVASAA